MNSKMIKSALAGLVLSASGLANAGLITNGDFSTNDLTGWTIVPTSDLANADSGYFFTFDNDGFSGLSQDVATDSLYSYELSFDSKAHQISGNEMQFQIDGSSFDVVTTTDWTTTTYNFMGTDSANILSFLFSTDSGTGTWNFDNVSLTASLVEVPEPTTLVIFALGLMGLAARRFNASK